MRGKRNYKKHLRQPDPKYKSVLVSQLINYLMRKGKKDTAGKIAYLALDQASEELGIKPLEVLEQAVSHVSPQVEVKSRRVGGATYQIPIDVSPARQTALAMRWIIAAAKANTGKDMATRLGQEFINAINDTGAAIKKKDDTRKMAEANRAFAHFDRY